MRRWFTIAFVGAAVLVTPVGAQVRAGSMGSSFGRGAASGHGITVSIGHPQQPNRFFPPTTFLAWPFYYSDYGPERTVVEEAPPRVVVVQTPPAAPVAENSPPEPLLIEWRGDHYVRVKLSDLTQPADYSEEPGQRAGKVAPKPATPQARELRPAVLVFRDGHKEEVSSYTIISGTLYTRTDFWATGTWTKKIQISDLDIPATLKLNQELGVRFVLPSGPNEVVTRM